MNTNPIIMVGVDAASIDLIRANLARLPNFRRVLEDGVYRSLASWGDVASGSVWPSFAAGKPPGEHGIYHHIQWNPASMRLQRVAADWLGYRPFWLDLAEFWCEGLRHRCPHDLSCAWRERCGGGELGITR